MYLPTFIRALLGSVHLVLILLLISCQTQDKPLEENTYLFLGHPYDWQSENRIDPRLELLDFSRFKGIWLGGDICARTTKDAATLVYLDSLFDLKSSTTHWSWGNHDLVEGEEQRLLTATGKEDYYTTYLDGMQLIVLNTNLLWHHEWSPAQEACERKQAQVDWLQQILDTVHTASHLILLHHHGLLNEFKDTTAQWGNLETSPVRYNCEIDSDFTALFYPQLTQIRERGIPVIMISGDVGMLRKRYDLTTPHSIHLLGSGINNSLDMAYAPDYVTNFNPDSVLIIKHQPATEQLNWSFVRLSDLVQEHLGVDDYDALSAELKVLLKDF
ncbi:MAG: hypothetical protein AAGJ93_08715 [Bacteroidota bacterium]